MSLTITINFNDTVNGTTNDVFTLNDADAATFLSVLATANAPGVNQQQIRQALQQGLQPPAVTPLTYDVLYHQLASRFWLGLQARVQSLQMETAQAAALAQAQNSVTVLSATAQTVTTPMAVKQASVAVASPGVVSAPSS